MKKITTMILTMICLMASSFVSAQDDELLTKDIENINIKGFKGVKSIFDKTTNEVLMHYMYFNNGQSMEVVFLDLELNISKRIPMPLANGDIQEAVFNGETIMFYTLLNGTANYYTLNLEGEILGQWALGYVYSEDGKTLPQVVPSEIDNGFYLVNPWNADANIFGNGFVGYVIWKMDASLTNLWKKEFFPAKKKEGIMVQTAESGFDRLIVIESKMSNWLTNKMTGTELVCFDGNNGDELYRSAMYSDDFNSLPTQITVSEDGSIGLGGEYFKGLKTKNTGSEGVFVTKLDPSGTEIAQNRSSWKEGIQQQMKRGNISLSGKNKVVFHDIIATEDGGFSLIGESFSKKQSLGEGSMLGLAAKIAAQAAGLDPDIAEKATQMVDLKNVIIALATGKYIGQPFNNDRDGFTAENVRTPTIMTIQDMMIFDFDESLDLQEVRKVEKPYTKVYAYPPYNGVGGLTLAKIMKGSGFFDYSFVSTDANTGKQMMIYNSMLSKSPNIGIVDIEKGSEAVPQQYVIKNLRKYGGFDQEAEEADEEVATEEAAEGDVKSKKMKYSNTGIAKANGGKVLIYYIEKEKKSTTGTLKLFHETINTGM